MKKSKSKYSLANYKQKKVEKKYTQFKTAKKSSPVLNRFNKRSNIKNLRNHEVRRERFYTTMHYTPPIYVHNSYSRFGTWDALWWWMILDNMNDARYSSMYYHHRNDPGVQEWRREASRLSSENKDLKEKLEQLDKKTDALAGQPVDPNYVPKGIDPDIMLAKETVASITKEFTILRLATASKQGNYYFFGSLMKENASSITVQPLVTNGSIDNLKRLYNKEIDGAIVQSDSFKVFKKEYPKSKFMTEQASLYKEYVHILVNKKSNIKSVKDLTAKNIMYIGKGSGSEVTWKGFCLLDKKYKKIRTEYANPSAAILKVASNPDAVMIYVSGLNSGTMKYANETSKSLKNNLRLINVDDWDFDDAKDQFGNKIYNFTKIPSNTYKNLQPGIFSGIETISVDAVLILSDSWIKENGAEAFEDFSVTVLESLPIIKKKMNQL